MKRLCIWSLAILMIALGACGPSSTGSSRPGEVINIGVPMSLTGVNAKLGLRAQQGYDLWADWVNKTKGGLLIGGGKHRVNLIYRDDQSDARVTATLTQRLISTDRVVLLLGTYGTTGTAQEAVVAERAGVPLFEGNGTSEKQIFSSGYRFVFSPSAPAKNYLKPVIDMAVSLTPRPSTVAIMSANDAFSTEVGEATNQYAISQGLKVVYNEQYPSNATDLSPLLAAVRSSDPDLLLQSGHDVEAVALVRGLKDLRFAPRMVSSTVGPAAPEFVRSVGSDAESLISPSLWTGAGSRNFKPAVFLNSADYIAAFHRKYPAEPADEDPAYQVAGATAAAIALGSAVEKANSIDPLKVRDAAASLDIQTLYGRIKFAPNGIDPDHQVMVVQVQKGKHVTVWPGDLADGRVQYPFSDWGSRS